MTHIAPLATVGRTHHDRVGGKGANLGELVRAGLPVPDGFVITTDAYTDFVAANRLVQRIRILVGAGGPEAGEEIAAAFVAGRVPAGLRREILRAYADLGGGPVAVRSSATAEDLEDASFAGQQETYLNVRGNDALLAAVVRCWASLWTDRAIAYRARQGFDSAGVRLAVVVQRMVPADAAGVMFTANPANGRRDEVMITAAWGLGEAVVSGMVDTDTLVVAKADGRVRSRSIADKTVQTAYADDGTTEQPVPEDRRRTAVLKDAAAAELARLGQQVEDHFAAPQDIEWARTGDGFVLLQARPITALPAPEADPPTDWAVPESSAMYVRASIVEQLPDPLSPLFADLVGVSVTRSIQALFREMLGDDVIQQADVDLPTVNGYAYYRYSRSGMLRLMLHSRKAFAFILTPDGAQDRWRSYSLPRYRDVLSSWTDRPLTEVPGPELLDGVAELLDAGTEYYTAVQTIIPIAATAEVVFTQLYNTLVRRATDPPAATYLLGFDSLPIEAEKSLFDLAVWTRSQSELAAALVGGNDPDPNAPEWAEWLDRLQDHLDRYGHTVYNLDFVNPVPADDPAPLIDTIRFYLRTPDRDPYARQRTTVERRERATTEVLGRLDPVRKKLLLRALRWAQRVAPVREDALAEVGLAWPQMRWMLAEIGDRLTAAGLVERPDDVYWLRRDELTAALAAADNGAERPSGLAEAIEERKQEWRGRRRVTPPQLLPERSWGRLFNSMMPATTQEQAADVLTGIGASAGRVTATARVLSGSTDFAELQPGDVLVASITTPAWTSLFTRAAAVVTDIGGPLSHSSIVAREFGIPAVLGTGVATRRITSGQTITVDGDAGRVILTGSDPGSEEPAASGPSSRVRGLVAAGALAAGVAGVVRWRRRRR